MHSFPWSFLLCLAVSLHFRSFRLNFFSRSSWTRQNSQSLNKIFICLPTILMWIYFVFSMMQLCLAFLIFSFSSLALGGCTYNYEGARWFPPECTFNTCTPTQTIPARRKQQKKSTHAKLKRAKPKIFHFFPFAVRLYPLNSTNHSHTHRSTINLFHFDFNRFMRKSFTLPMCLKSSCFVPWRLPRAHILFLTNENEKIYVWVLFFSFIRLHVTPNIVRHLLYENLI